MLLPGGFAFDDTIRLEMIMNDDFLPVTIEECYEREIWQPDFIVVSADAYVDHPSFGHALIARLIESQGFSVAVLPQPVTDEEFAALGEPKCAFLVSCGVVDSMVDNYTVAKRPRAEDVYSENGVKGRRPDRVATVYARTLKRLFPDSTVILGGIEASLRRFSHYDYWSDSVMRSVLYDSGADLLIYGMGDQHLEIAVSKLLERYKCEVTLETPKVAFRETIKKNSDVDTKYKKQSGGHGQYGHVKMKFAASGDLDTPYIFEETVVGGAVPKNYFPAVEKGLQESVLKGPLAGYPVVGVKATLYDGSYHPVDSSEMAFKTATVQAFKKGFMEAGPILLEPIASIKVIVPDDYTGDVMGDLNKRRGRVLGMNPIAGGLQEIVADIPMTGVFGYCTILRSMTGGRGTYSYEFARYEQAPSDVQEAEIAKRAAEE